MKSCPVCCQTNLAFKFGVTPSAHYGIDLPRYELYRCRTCGYWFTLPLPTGEIQRRLYGSEFFATAQQDLPLGPDGRLAPEARRWPAYRNAAQRVRMLRKLRPSGSLLDVGCGKGVFVLVASSYYRAVGIDVSVEAVQWGRRLGLELAGGDFRTADFEGRRFDIITLWDVLACMADPLEGMRCVSQLLTPRGLVALTVPEAGSLVARCLGRYWPLMIPPVNVGFYRRRAVETLAEASGLRLVRYGHPGKWVGMSFLFLKLRRTLGLAGRAAPSPASGSPWSLYLNLRDIATAVLQRV